MGSVDDDLDARISKLRRDIDDFVKDNKLDERVGRIMQNMHPLDVQKVIKINFPDDSKELLSQANESSGAHLRRAVHLAERKVVQDRCAVQKAQERLNETKSTLSRNRVA
eukprot:g27386.t1